MLIFGYCKINGIEYLKFEIHGELHGQILEWCYMNFNTYNFKNAGQVLRSKPEQEIEKTI